jgi:hypothetical protein
MRPEVDLLRHARAADVGRALTDAWR